MTTTPNSFVLDVQGRAFPLAYGASLSAAELPMLAPSAVGGPVAQVSANPNDPTQLGLQNLTAQPWTALMPDGSQQQVDPGRSARLIDGVTLLMGGAQAQIRAAQAPAQAAFGQAQPAAGWTQGQGQAFGQPQASPFGQQPAQNPAFGQPQGQAGFTPSPFGQPEPQAPQYGQPQPNGAWPPSPAVGAWAGAGGAAMNMGANDSGTGATAVLPPQLKGFNVGAFFLNIFWAIANKTWIGLLALIPYVGFVMAIVLGVKGNEWAWQNRRWDSIEQFQLVQKKWATASLICFIASFVLGILYVVLMGAFVAHNTPTQQPVTP